MKSNVLEFPQKTVHKNIALAPGDLLVSLQLRVPAPLAMLIITLIDSQTKDLS